MQMPALKQGHNLFTYQFLNVLRFDPDSISTRVGRLISEKRSTDHAFSAPPVALDQNSVCFSFSREQSSSAETARVVLDVKERLLVVQCPTADDASALAELVRDALFARLKLMIPATRSPSVVLNQWLSNPWPCAFTIELSSGRQVGDNSPGASVEEHDLEHIILTWRDEVRFTLTPQMGMRILKPIEYTRCSLQDRYCSIFRELINDLRVFLQ